MKSIRALTFLCLALALTCFAQVPPPTLPETSKQVSDHVHVILGFPNIAIVTGDRATLVVDTGLGPPNGNVVARVARRLSKVQKLYLTTTHFHPEHAAGESGFPSETIIVLPSIQEQEAIEHGVEMIEMFRGRNAENARLLEGVKGLRPADVTFPNELTIDLGGGVTARLMWLGAAHTKGDEIVFVDPDRTMITGDVVQNKVVPTVPAGAGNLNSWVTVLDKLEPLKPRVIVPDHSAVGDGSLIASERAFIVDMRSRAQALKKQGVSPADAAKQLTEYFRSAYPDWVRNPAWPNVNAMTGFVNELYKEAE